MPGPIDQLLDGLSDDEAQQTEALRRVAALTRDLWETEPESPELDRLAQRVGDAARVEANRTALGESGLLEFFCAVVSTPGLRSALAVQCLRIIGNSSADKDENRERVIASGCLPSIVSFLDDDSMLAFVIPVLFNISVDYEPAQKAIYKAGINPQLVSLISGPRRENALPLLDYVCKLIGFVATQEPEANLSHPATPFAILSLTQRLPLPETEEVIGLSSVALAYLAQEQFHQAFLETPGSISIFFYALMVTSLDQADDQALLKQVQAAFMATLADLSALPLFAERLPLDDPVARGLRRWITEPHYRLQSAACIAFGNIARSDDKCRHFVHQLAIHEPLIETLAHPVFDDAGLQHAILGFLRNLAIPAENKPVLGAAGLFEAGVLPLLWGLDTRTQVQFDAVSLTRLLLVGCPANVRRICAPLHGEDAASSTPARSPLHLLMDLSAHSDQEPTQMETARAITTVCRVLHSGPQTNGTTEHEDEDSPTWLEQFYADHSTITDAMLRLGLQEKFPVLRSEALFVFALMARTPEGAAAVARCISSHPELVTLLVEIVTDSSSRTTISSSSSSAGGGTDVERLSAAIANLSTLEAQPPPPPPATTTPTPTTTTTTTTTTAGPQAEAQTRTTRDVDRENVLVLLAELLPRRRPNSDGTTLLLPSTVRETLAALLHEGGQRVLLSRARTAATAAAAAEE
ncbi:armadillo-type protein [Xylaria palmicola]|nr:armadillo-type protein [Xylaria palmicola]